MNEVQQAWRVRSARERAAAWIESRRTQNLIVSLILLNAVTLGLETSQTMMERFGILLVALDRAILGAFVLEIGVKLFALGPRFFRQPWNVFDFLIVGIALVPASGPLAVMRVLRVLRVLRLLSTVPRLRFVVESLLHSLPGISSIALLMVVLYYVFAVMATGLFGAGYPEWFGTIGRSMYTLFQIMTLESWSMGIVRPVMETHPYAWVFFVPFILVATFTILNLFIAIIVNTMQTMHDTAIEKEEVAIAAVVHREDSQLEQELRVVREELRAMRELLGKLGQAPGE
jgi:voltage-gated sodium channel